MPAVNDTPTVVYHVASLGNWQDVVQEQMALLAKAGLTEVRLTHVGQGLDWIQALAKSFGVSLHVVRSDQNTDHYETFAMMEIERLAKEERTDRPILYLHTKGVSAPHDRQKAEWRRSMNWNLVLKWREAMALLQGNDAVGQNWCPWQQAHFSGNFWLVRPGWIRKLRPFAEFHNANNRVRYSCELWIGSHADCRVVSLGMYSAWYADQDYSRLYPSVTWVAFATPNYAADLSRLVASAARLGPCGRLSAQIVPGPFVHTQKFQVLRAALDSCKTTHLFWIDADCEFVSPVWEGDLVEPGKPLTAVRHFCYDGPLGGLPQRLHEKVADAKCPLYWQSCLFGGEVEAMRRLLDAMGWMEREHETYDEHGVCIELNRRAADVYTLPCRFAAPSSFAPFPETERHYRERAGGPPAILHHNRNLNR